MRKVRYRFFYHYNKQKKKMTVHFKGTCYSVDNIYCAVPCFTKHNKRQPFIVMQGEAVEVKIMNLTDGKAAIIDGY